jgi:YVTN family beta-propeller protein
MRRALLGVVLALVAAAATGCGGSGSSADSPATAASSATTSTTSSQSRVVAPPSPSPGNGPTDVYAADGPGMLSPTVRHFPSRVYVPNSLSNTVSVIDPKTHRVIDQFPVGALPQHVTPSYDLKTLWVDDNAGNSLTPIDPRTGKPGKPVPVTDPYNLYFTPDGQHAIVVAEAEQRLDFRDPHTMKLQHTLAVPCPGVNHMDFTADGRYLVASCEFGARLVVVDVAQQKLVGTLSLPSGSMPQDVKLSPDGRTFYVADMMKGGVWLIDASRFRREGFIPTGAGAHGLFISRDARKLYVTNRSEGSISVISIKSNRQTDEWGIPGGGSPDMGGISADGKVLWVSGRYDGVVYAISTKNGKLLATIPVGNGPHGLCVYPQPGRYSLGHTGVFR